MQYSVAPGNGRAVLAGLRSDAHDVAGRHRASGTSRRRTFGITAALLIAAGLVVHTGWLALKQTDATPRAYPSFIRSQRHSGTAADDWIRANLPSGDHVLADGFDPPAGYEPVSLSVAGANWKNYCYLVTSTTTDPSADSALAPVWKSSTAVAIFRDAEVRIILPRTPPEEIRRNRDNDRVERLQAGAALQDNPHLTLSASAKDILAAGQLDLRAATALTGLASQIPFALNEIVVVAPEAAAEMPARIITVYSSDPAGFTRALNGVAAPLAPDQVTVGENGAIRLHWPLSITPIPSVN